ncbi:AMP-binding protein [Sphingomonas sp. AX6]|uniref:AMP-binding protein n=1 Tax=Sphingomonas sp. AX6 TaxID=2653171 RepID=UPI0012F416CE|nr:AMP-binding protein [Sphingomonas sp. AX6]VXC98596.1 putative Novobiocin biosynthesis protein H [Sphingomonas sp. AX6]
MNALSTTFYELFADNLARRADKPLIVDPERSYTYAEVGALCDWIAAWLVTARVLRGDRVIVQLRKSAHEVAAMLAVAKIGAVFVNVNAALTADQLRFIAQDSGAAAFILEPAAAPAVDGARILLPAEDTGAFVEPAPRVGIAPVLDCDLAAIIYTSGSTGTPKGVMLSHRNIVTGSRSVARYLNLAEDDRLLSVLPYSFDYGLNQLTTMLLMGGTIVHHRVAMASEVVHAMVRHDITGLAAVPPLMIQLVRLLAAQTIPLPSLRRVTNSGGAIPDATLSRMPDVFPGVDIVLMYGLTEAFRSTFLSPDRFMEKRGSIGRSIPSAEIHVIKHGGGVAGPGEQGELVHRGPLVSMGYWNRPDATAEKIRPCPELAARIGNEPVVYSGDTVRIDADGDLWFVGRTDALIKTSGFRVSPDEVEDIVHAGGQVADVVAFGVADDLLGQNVQVAVTLLPGATRDALMAHCRRAMPPYMVPRAIHVWPDAMPRTPSGKLARPDVVLRTTAAQSEPVSLQEPTP